MIVLLEYWLRTHTSGRTPQWQSGECGADNTCPSPSSLPPHLLVRHGEVDDGPADDAGIQLAELLPVKCPELR